MQTAIKRPALGRYNHVRMVEPPLWLPVRGAPRSTTGRAKASGLAYERATISAIRLAFVNCTDFSRIFQLINNVLNHPSRIENKQILIESPELIAGQWIEYQKNNIKHLCQPDLLIIFWPSGNNPGPIPNRNPNPPRGNPNHLTPSRKVSNKNFGGGKSTDPHLLTTNLLPLLIICCEIKLTYTPSAIKKLNQLYLPLVDSIFSPLILLPLIICKNLTNYSPPHSYNLLSAILNPLPLTIYPGSGNFRII